MYPYLIGRMAIRTEVRPYYPNMNAPVSACGYVVETGQKYLWPNFLGDSGAQVIFDAFIDLMCPYSRAAYPVLKQVADSYKTSEVQVRLYVS